MHIETRGALEERMNSLKEEEQQTNFGCQDWLLTEVERLESIFKIIQGLKNGSTVGVNNVSYKWEIAMGTAAWRIEVPDTDEFIEGKCISPGAKHLQSAYQSELVGQLAILHTIHDICQFHNISSGQLTLACDDKTTLNMTKFKAVKIVSPKQKHSDIVGPMVKLRDALKIDVNCVHVTVHQGDWVEYNDLDRLVQMNICMDLEAKEFMEKILHQGFKLEAMTAQHLLAFGDLTVDRDYVFNELVHTTYKMIADKKTLMTLG